MAASKKSNKNGQIEGMFNVSQSKVKTYRRCKYAYYLKYIEKLKKKVKGRPLQFGTLVHSILEHWAEGNDWEDVLKNIAIMNKKLFAAEREMYGEIIDDVRMIMTEYFEYWGEKDLRFERINGRSAEHVFNIEILPGVNWNGKIDFKGVTKNKSKWLGEHKTFNRRPSADDRWRNLQSSTYIRANDILGWKPVDGVCWDYIWSKSPQRPGRLAEGKKELSNKRIDTLPITVRETVLAEGFKMRDHADHMRKAELNYELWFERIYNPVSDDVVTQVFDDFVADIQEMVDRQEKKANHWPKNIERHCSWCDFEPICRAELQGLDVEYVKEREYTLEKDHGLEIPDATE